MKIVKYSDSARFLRAAYVKDTDAPSAGPRGIPAGPQLEDLDWDELKREINNILIGADLLTWDDVLHNQQAFSQALTAFKRRLIGIYRRKS